MTGIIGLVVLVLDIWALFAIWTSSASLGGKLLWSLLILVLPVLGFIIWLIAGPRSARA